jgi:Carboxypeptidase regulatory-like domain
MRHSALGWQSVCSTTAGGSSLSSFRLPILSSLALFLIALLAPTGANAQMAGYGAISGTVTDASGAVIGTATVTATLVSQNASTTRSTTGVGDYNITPLTPGVYTVTVSAKGFQTFVQQNVTVNALQTVPLNIKLAIGTAEQTVTVNTAPPVLETTDATLGAVMDNQMYSSLPLLMGAGGNADQRRATDFAVLMPGVQNTYAASSSNNSTDASGGVNGSNPAGGTVDIYIDGIDLPSPFGVGDPRPTWTAIGMDSIDQFQVQTIGYSAQYAGQGVQNYSIKQGTNQIHGSLYEYLRNTVLDAWPTNNKNVPTVVGLPPAGAKCSSASLTSSTSWCALGGVKPEEIMNEFGIVLSGPIIKNKLFLFYNYGQYRYQKGALPSVQTLPTYDMMGYDSSGNPAAYADYTGFQAAQVASGKTPQGIYDPASQIGTTSGEANCQNDCTRTEFANNQIPSSRFSQAAAYINKYLLPIEPTVNQSQYFNNVAYGTKAGLSNWYQTGRLDYNINPRHQISLIVAFGRQASTGLNSGGTLPPPFNTSQTYHPVTNVDIFKETWTISPHMVNQFAAGVDRYKSVSTTPDMASIYSTTNTGILNMPAGQASFFPQIKWSGTNVPGTWAGYSWNSKSGANFTVVDNLQWELGRHSLTLGGQYLDTEYNLISPTTYSSPMSFTFSGAQTSGYSGGKGIANSGAGYASYMLGAVNTSSVTVGVPELSPRWYDPSFWGQDNYKVTSKLTLNLGLRWDIWTPIVEKNNQFTWLNPTATNPVTGNLGTFAAAGGSSSDGWHTGVRNLSGTWWKNIAPRFGVAYAVNNKTVLRASYGLTFARGNWVSDQGQHGSPSTAGLNPAASEAPTVAANQPAFYWDGTACGTASGGNGAGLSADTITPCGWTGSLAAPSSTLPSGVSMAGYGAVETNTAKGKNGVSLSYWDPHYGGRSPEYENWSFGLERQITNDMSISVSYVGSEGHFIQPSGSIGAYPNNKLPESYAAMAGYSLASATGTTYSACSGATCQYTLLTQKLSVAPTAIAQAQGFGFTPQNPYSAGSGQTYYTNNVVSGYFSPFPQFSGVGTATNFVGNENYNALQVVARQRPAHGFNWMVAYTWSKSIDDLGTFRTYDNPRLDRSLSAADQPQSLTITAVYQLPVGKGHMFGENLLYRAIASDWTVSGISTLRSGLPLVVTGSGCGGSSILNTCMPNLVQGQAGRQYSIGKTASGQPVSFNSSSANYIGTINYVNPGAFTVNQAGNPVGSSTDAYGTTDGQAINVGGGPVDYVPGNVTRVAPLGMFAQKNVDVDMALKRSFPIYHEWNLSLEADMANIANHATYGVPSCNVTKGSTASFCTVTKMAPGYQPRQLQVSGRISW